MAPREADFSLHTTRRELVRIVITSGEDQQCSQDQHVHAYLYEHANQYQCMHAGKVQRSHTVNCSFRYPSLLCQALTSETPKTQTRKPSMYIYLVITCVVFDTCSF